MSKQIKIKREDAINEMLATVTDAIYNQLDIHWVKYWFKEGFKGVRNMTDAELAWEYQYRLELADSEDEIVII